MLTSLIIILNLILLECMLSIDNAAVLAVMVRDLPDKKQQNKALTYGMAGAYIFRGLCLVLASYIVKILWLKIVGGLYLAWLAYSHFTSEADSAEEGFNRDSKGWYGWIKSKIGLFWSTIILVEVMDLAFSVDNVLAAAAFTNNIYLIIAGVFIGILAMRIVATLFRDLLDKYANLETAAFVVIAMLSAKLILSGILDLMGNNSLDNHWIDLGFSAFTLIVFIIPILKTKFKAKQTS